MLSNIARHELRDIVRDGRFRWTAGFVIGLLLIALLSGWTYQRDVASEHASAERLTRDTWLAQPAKDPHTAAHYGAYAFKPRGPLTLFDSGVNQFAGVAAWLEAHKQNEFQFRPAQDRSSVARLGQLTGAATLQYFIPLLIVLLAFTKFAGERENGTLRQILAAGVPVRVLTTGKLLGVLSALALVLLPAAVIGATAMVVAVGPDAAGTIAGRVTALVVAYGGYFAVFTCIAIALSALMRRSSHALAALVAFWVVNAIVAPRAAADVSRWLHPVPTAFEFAQRVHHDSYDGLSVHEYNVKRAAYLRERLTREYDVTRIQDLPVNVRGMDYLEREEQSNRVWEGHYATLWGAFERQAHVHDLAAWVAPFMAVRGVSMALAGADFFHHRDFAQAAEAYRRALVLAMNIQLAYADGSQRMGAYTADASYWATVGPFEYRQRDVWWALSNARQSVAALLAWMAIGGLALALSVRRLAVD